MNHGGLPAEIWGCVAFFLPLQDLFPLVSLNRAFYDIVLDTKYKEIHWDKLDAQMTKTLVRLRRVRRLHIRAWFIKHLIRKEEFTPHSDVVTSKPWLSQYIWLPPRITGSTGRKSSTADRILESMTQAVRLMTHVTEYSFEWRDLSPTADVLRFLCAARAAFGVSLRKLTLHAQLHHFPALLTTVDFENLEELELYLDHDHGVDTDIATDVLRQCIAPFVNHFRRSLASLLISSASNADMSPLLDALHDFPRLRKLVGRFVFDSAHLSDPRGLVKLLQTHSDAFTRVELRSSFAATASSEEEEQRPISTWGVFSAAVVTDPRNFANLTSLKLPGLTTFDGTLQCLRRSADTLTSLHLTDHFLGTQELADLIRVFAHRPFDAGLQTLHVGLSIFTVEMLDLLANQMSGLQSLNLVLTSRTVNEVSHHAWLGPRTTLFSRSLADRSYPDWKLSNLGIWDRRFLENTAYSTPEEVMLMQHISRCIPGLQTFKGEPKNEGETCRWCFPDSYPP